MLIHVQGVAVRSIQFLPEAQDDPQRRRPDIRKAQLLLPWEPVVRVAHDSVRITYNLSI